ncbi:6834_t:CDS:2, partial [Racocetra fulgida]
MDAKREREVAVKAVLKSECNNYLYEYLILRREQDSFIETSQSEHARYLAELTEQQNFNERAQLALNAFEQGHPLVCSCDDPLVSGNVKQDFDKQKYPLVYFCDDPLVSSNEVAEEVKQRKEEENAVRSASLGHLSIFGKTLTQYANTQEASTKDMNLSTNHRKRGIEVVIDNEENGSNKKEKENTENDSDNNENLPSRNNNENSSSGFENEEINFDLTNISKELNREPTVEVSSIIVLCWPCPYSNFTNQEWKKITKTNPYTLQESPLPPEISLSLRETASRRLIDGDVFMNSSESELINDVPILNSEFKPLGCTPLQEKMDRLKVQLKARKSINQQLQRKGGPGEAVMFLNIGNSMESFFMDLKCDGLYRSWPFLTTKLVVDKSTIPLAEFAISHLMALEVFVYKFHNLYLFCNEQERVEKIAKDFKYRSSQFTPPAQMSYIREFPDTPQ